MPPKNLTKSIAELLLEGDGLEVSKRIVDDMFLASMKSNPANADRVESLGKIRGELRKLGEKEPVAK